MWNVEDIRGVSQSTNMHRRNDPDRGKTEGRPRLGYPTRCKRSTISLEFANYYRHFVKDFVAIVDPLTSLTKKDVEWQWGPYQRCAFQQSKESLCAALVLLFPDPKLPYTVVNDVSSTAAGGVLMQDQGNGLQPLAFLSRWLKPTEQRYSAYEQELVAIAYYL